MTDTAVHITDLTRSFGALKAVDTLSLEVSVGEVFGFLGHNGAGKTTTVRLLNGVLNPDSGSMTVLGLDPQVDGTAVRSRTGVLTETPSLDERLTATENLTLYADLYAVPETLVGSRVEAVLDQFGLGDRASEKVGGYSKGMKQRLALARAFLHEPELVFLDEPTSGLDPVAAQEVHEMIRRVSRDEGRTVFLCTHNLIEAQRLCDRLGIMEHGRLVAVGTPQELARNINPERIYKLEVMPGQMEAAQQLLSSMAKVHKVERDNGGLDITVSDPDAIPDALAALVARSIRIYSVIPQQTSLEDVYMAIHKEESR